MNFKKLSFAAIIVFLISLNAVFAQFETGIEAITGSLLSIIVIAVVLIFFNIVLLFISNMFGISHRWANFATLLAIILIGVSFVEAYVYIPPEVYELVFVIGWGGVFICVLLALREFVKGLNSREIAKRWLERDAFRGVRGGKRFGKRLAKEQAEEENIEKQRMELSIKTYKAFMERKEILQFVEGEMARTHGMKRTIREILLGIEKESEEAYIDIEREESEIIKEAEEEEEAREEDLETQLEEEAREG